MKIIEYYVAIIQIIMCLMHETSLEFNNDCVNFSENNTEGFSKEDFRKFMKLEKIQIQLRGRKFLVIADNFIDSFDAKGNIFNVIGVFKNSKLKHLIISDNNIKCLLGNQIRLEGLLSLDLSNNKINHIENDAFPDSLVELNLNYNRLSSFGMDDALVNINNLYLRHNYISSFEFNVAAVNKLERLDLGYNNLRKFNFSGLEKLAYLVLEANVLDYLDSTDFSKLYNLRELDISQNRLQDLNVLDGNKFPELLILNVKSNYLRRIPNNFFSNTKKLSELDLSRNNLLDYNYTNDSLYKLWRLKMNHMNLNIIDSSNFQNLETLNELELSHNKISSFEWNIRTPTLWRLDLSYNSLARINDNFGNLRKLGSLDLSHNEISSFHIAHNELNELWKLKLNHNELVKIDDSDIPNLNYLLLFDLSNNNLLTFSISPTKLQRLRIIDLSFNNIHSYDTITFPRFPSLRFLSLRNNFIRYVDPSVLYNQSDLYYLDLSHNLLTFFKQKIQKWGTSIRTLNFFGNPLNCIHFKQIESFCIKNKIQMNVCDYQRMGNGYTPFCVDYGCDCEYDQHGHHTITNIFLDEVPKFDAKNCSFSVLAHNGA